MKVIYTDVLVIGAGLAGLRMAVGAKRRGHDSIILSLVPPKRSHSKAAQGGMQASLANVIKGVGDNEDVHFGDTVPTGVQTRKSFVCSLILLLKLSVNWLLGACPGAVSLRVTVRLLSTAKKLLLPNVKKLPA